MQGAGFLLSVSFVDSPGPASAGLLTLAPRFNGGYAINKSIFFQPDLARFPTDLCKRPFAVAARFGGWKD